MFCSKCGNANEDDARFCAKCGASMEVEASPATATTASAQGSARTVTKSSGHRVHGKSPVVALVLSILLGSLGIGQFYNGDWKKGLTMLGATLLLGFVTAGLVPFGIWIWSMFDGYKVANGDWKAW